MWICNLYRWGGLSPPPPFHATPLLRGDRAKREGLLLVGRRWIRNPPAICAWEEASLSSLLYQSPDWRCRKKGSSSFPAALPSSTDGGAGEGLIPESQVEVLPLRSAKGAMSALVWGWWGCIHSPLQWWRGGDGSPLHAFVCSQLPHF